ncbi:hypothetical protein HK098_001877 [Nowakowskiella sp. JEL0407]|nr:hypothetical protein HK098_001877 [Nowakowskiella sp. JEL0407]
MFALTTHSSQPNSERVKLNIGGTRYETYVSTLQRDPDSLLGTMFASRNSQILKPDPITGEYFFDRNGRTFEIVLDYCRTGKLTIPQGVSLDSVREEMDFWQIGMPIVSRTTSKQASPALANALPPSLQLTDLEDNEIDDVCLTIEEEDFCQWLGKFCFPPYCAEDFALIFKQRRYIEDQQRPMNDLLAVALMKKGLTTTSDSSAPTSRRASLSSITSESPVYVRSSLFSQALSPTTQLFLERTLAMYNDAKSSHISQIRFRVSIEGEVSGVPQQLDRVASQKQYWQTFAKMIQRCAGVSPPNTSAMMQGSDARTQLQLLHRKPNASSAILLRNDGPFSLPPLALAPSNTHRSIGIVDSELISAWEAAEELYEFKKALQSRLFGKEIDLDVTQPQQTPQCMRVEVVRKKYPVTSGKVSAVEFLSSWEVILVVP